MTVGRAQAAVVALTGTLVLALVLGPVTADGAKERFQRTKPHVSVGIHSEPSTQPGGPSAHLHAGLSVAVLPDDTLQARSARGTLKVHHRGSDLRFVAERAEGDPDQPLILGRVFNPDEGRKVLIERIVLGFVGVGRDSAGDGGEPGRDPATATVVIEPDDPSSPCGPARGCPASAHVTFDDREGQAIKITFENMRVTSNWP